MGRRANVQVEMRNLGVPTGTLHKLYKRELARQNKMHRA
jgi:hypothetical protein